jgi:hypothetical protein
MKISDYQLWCDKVKTLPLDLPGAKLQSGNEIKVVTLEDGENLLLKIISDDVVYIPRLKVLGEVAYALFDYHLNPAERVTPNVCPVAPNILWRQFIPGLPGEIWRGKLYKAKRSLDAADLIIIKQVLESRFAQRIALLDFIFLCQDRSARNWIKDGRNRFWAIDNGMLWPYQGCHADKETIRTGRVDHLNNPIEALISYDQEFEFKNGIFSSLYAGNTINDGLLYWLSEINWEQYFIELRQLISQPLDYPLSTVYDWRFAQMKSRAEWLLSHRRFPTVSETSLDEWKNLICKPAGGIAIWTRQWER